MTQDQKRCYYHKWGGGEPCLADAVGPRIQKLGNMTDEFVWCEKHGGVSFVAEPQEQKTETVEGGKP